MNLPVVETTSLRMRSLRCLLPLFTLLVPLIMTYLLHYISRQVHYPSSALASDVPAVVVVARRQSDTNKPQRDVQAHEAGRHSRLGPWDAVLRRRETKRLFAAFEAVRDLAACPGPLPSCRRGVRSSLPRRMTWSGIAKASAIWSDREGLSFLRRVRRVGNGGHTSRTTLSRQHFLLSGSMFVFFFVFVSKC